MAYLDETNNTRRLVALGFVALLHVFFIWALISGLALKVTKNVLKELDVVDVKDLPKVEEAPPPPPELEEIPPYVPPPDIDIQLPPPPAAPITTQSQAPPPPPPPRAITVEPPPQPKPEPTIAPTRAIPDSRNNTAISEDDYPSQSLRAEEEGVVQIRVTVNEKGRVAGCEIMKSSGFPRLDEKTCQLATQRFRYKPATLNGAPVPGGEVKAVRWQISRK